MNLQDIGNLTDAEKLALVKAIQENVAASKAQQVSAEAGQYAKLVVDAIKKIKADLEERYAVISSDIAAKAAVIKDGKDGLQGPKGEKGDTGLPGRNGLNGKDGKDGKDGADGLDGNGVVDARIDFDGSLIITLSNGSEINAGEVVPFDVAEKIKVIGNGGGTSQYVLDLISALQTQIDAISPTLVITDTFVVGSQAEMLALTAAEKGDVAVRTDLNKTFILKASPYSTLSNWQELLTPTDVVTSVAGRTGAVTLSTTDISGLGTIATQAASNVAITGGTISGTTLTSDTVSNNLAFTPVTAPSYSEGLIFYDSTDHTLCYYNDNSAMKVNIAQESIIRVRNQTGSTIPDGTVVYVNGATGNTPTVALAIATSFAASDIIGVTTTSIANNGYGYVTVSGLVNGIDTSAFTDGQTVYVSATSAGTYTATEPSAPNYSVQVGVVLRANPSVGTLLVAPQFISTEVSHVVGSGTMISQNANNVTITGGSITGITDLAVADGGTGASTAAGARTNLGLVIGTDVLAPNGSAAALTSFPTLNQNTTGSAGSLVTTGFSIVESGGKLLFKYGATTIASMSSTGVITSATNIISNGTP